MPNLKSSKVGFSDESILALTTNFQLIDFGFITSAILMFSDSGVIEYSIDGANVGGRLKNGETRDLREFAITRLFLRGVAGGEQYRIEAR